MSQYDIVLGLQFNHNGAGFFTRENNLRRCKCSLQVCVFIADALQPELDTEGCQVAKDVSAAQVALVDIFERIENFFKRLET